MVSRPDKNKLRLKRHRRIRGEISGTAERPRLSIPRPSKNIYAQVVDDVVGVTLISASTLDKSVPAEGAKFEQTQAVGKAVAEAAKKDNVITVVFGKSGYLHYDRTQALADVARKNELEF